jgi:hypothetical protein
MSATHNKQRPTLPVAGKADVRLDARVGSISGLRPQQPTGQQPLPVVGSRRLDTLQTVNLFGHPMSTEHRATITEGEPITRASQRTLVGRMAPGSSTD